MVYVRMFLEGQQMRVRPRTTSGPRREECHKFAYLMMKIIVLHAFKHVRLSS